MTTTINYHSGTIQGSSTAEEYSKTVESPHRFLAYRDFDTWIANLKQPIKKVLDFGCGTGVSSKFLQTKNLDVTGIDISPQMIIQAKSSYPDITFHTVSDLQDSDDIYDLVFSSFVLFELSSKEKIISYLKQVNEQLPVGGYFIAITGSEFLHQKERKWKCFNVDFPENAQPSSGDLVKLGLKNPPIEFDDYYWKESDYLDCLKEAGFTLINSYYPLGLDSDKIIWKDEISIPPFLVLVVQKLKD